MDILKIQAIHLFLKGLDSTRNTNLYTFIYNFVIKSSSSGGQNRPKC